MKALINLVKNASQEPNAEENIEGINPSDSSIQIDPATGKPRPRPAFK